MSSAPARPSPFVTIVVPTLDEERSIAECLDAIAAQDWPADRLEVLVLLGSSRDRTREIVSARAGEQRALRLLENPGGLVAHALNLGIAAARGEILVRIDAHTLPAPDYVRRSVEALAESGADVVGGPMQGRGSTPVGRAVALAMSHPFGVGTARFRFARRREEVDTVYLGAFPRDLFARIGGFNEALVRNQDYEMNWRIRSSGGKVVVDPGIRSIYVTRSTLAGVWRQYRDYGFWKQRMLRLHPRSLRARQLVAPLFVAALAAGALAALGALAGILPPLAALPLGLLAASYLLAATAVSLTLAARHGWRLLPRLLAVFPTLHVAWGLGFLTAIASPGADLGGTAVTRPAPVPRAPFGIGLVEAATFAAVVVAMLWLVPYSEAGGEADRALALRLPVLLALAGGVAAALSRRRDSGALDPASPRSAFALLALAWLGWTALCALLAPDPWRAWLGAPPRLQGWITLALGPLLALAWVTTPARPGRSDRLSLAPRLAGPVAALYALLQAAGLDPLRWEGLEALRPGATQGNPVFLGAVLVLVAPFSIAAAIDQLARGKRRAALVSTAAYLTQLAAAGVAGGRAALLALGAGAVVQAAGLASSRGARRAGRRLLVGGVVALLALGALALSGRLPGFDPDAGTARQRRLLWSATVDLMASEPSRLVTGYGPEGLALALPRHLPEELPARVWAPGRYQDRAHNFELDLVASLGLPGLALALALFAVALHRPLRRLGLLGAAPEAGAGGAASALDTALAAALAGHLLELQLGFRTVASDLLFWVVAAVAAGRALAPARSVAGVAWPRRALGRALVLPLLLLGFATVVPPQVAGSRAGLAALLVAGATLLALALAAGESHERLSAFARRELTGALVAIGGFFGLHGLLLARGRPHVELLALALAALAFVTVGLGRRMSSGAAPIGTSPLALPALAALGLAVPWVALPLAGGVAWKLGATELARGRTDLAVESLARAVELDGHWTELRLELARARLRRAAALEPLRRREEIARVESELLAWRARHPLDPAIDEQLGFLYAQRAGLAPSAERRRWLERSLDRHRAVAERLPASGAAQRNLGAILLDLGERPEALERLEAGVRLAPRSLEGWLLLARGRLEARELSAAEAAVRAALALDGRRTIALLESLVRAQPSDRERRLLFALAAVLAGERDAALATLGALEPGSPAADRPLLERIRALVMSTTDPAR